MTAALRWLRLWAVLGWPVLALLVVARHRPVPRRRPLPVGIGADVASDPDAIPVPAPRPGRLGAVLVVVGTHVLRLLSRVTGRHDRVSARAIDEAAARRVALALVVGILAVPLAPAAVPVVLVVVLGGPLVHERRRVRRRAVAVAADLPDVLDLLRLALDAGCTVPQALQAVATHHRGALAGALRTVAADLTLHGSVDDALEGLLRREGEPVRPLCQSLLAGVRHGLPVAAVLDALGTEARAVRRRRAEAVARRLPVALLFPLVACTLPAFALLTVVPLLAGGLRSVRW